MYSGRRCRDMARADLVRRPPPRVDHVGDQALVARRVLARHRHGLAHAGVARERGLDLAQLDAEAADLDLVVDAAEELEGAVRPPADEVAGAVEPRARGVANGFGTKRSAVSSGRSE